VYCLHVECMAKDKGDPFAGAQIGESVPGEHAFHGNDKVFSIRRNSGEEQVGFGLDVLVQQDGPLRR